MNTHLTHAMVQVNQRDRLDAAHRARMAARTYERPSMGALRRIVSLLSLTRDPVRADAPLRTPLGV